jgi:TetR/AcrR family transcriptional repressor of nem operon
MPRMKKFSEEQALGQALELFWEKGYEATSLNDLTSKLNIGKGSFYDTFSSKRAIFDRCLIIYQIQSFETFDRMLDTEVEAKVVLKNLLKSHTNLMLADKSSKGCFIANSTAELSDDLAIQAFLKNYNDTMQLKLITWFSESKYEDQSNELADLFLTHLTGISILSKYLKDPERFERSNNIFLSLFK